jgi:hypothetical protein
LIEFDVARVHLVTKRLDVFHDRKFDDHVPSPARTAASPEISSPHRRFATAQRVTASIPSTGRLG